MKFEVEYTTKGIVTVTRGDNIICIIDTKEIVVTRAFKYVIEFTPKYNNKELKLTLNNEEEVQLVIKTINKAMTM